MKTKKSRLERKCDLCKGMIKKGDRYALKSVAAGKEATWSRDDRPVADIPAWAWTSYRIKVPVCDACANP